MRRGAGRVTRGSRGSRWARFGGAAIVGTVMAVMAGGTALAESATGVAGGATGAAVRVTHDGKTRDADAGAITITISGKTRPAYCIDFTHDLAGGATYTEATWNEAKVKNLAQIKWLLVNGFPTADAAKLASDAKASTAGLDHVEMLVRAANQVAIWHFSDQVDLAYSATDTGRDGFIKKVYDYLVAGAEKAEGSTEPAPTLKISPSTATGTIGSKAGPFTIEAAGGEVTLKATGGAVVDKDGKP